MALGRMYKIILFFIRKLLNPKSRENENELSRVTYVPVESCHKLLELKFMSYLDTKNKWKMRSSRVYNR